MLKSHCPYNYTIYNSIHAMSYFSFVAIAQKHLKEFTDSTLSDRNEDSFALAVFHMGVVVFLAA